MTRPPVYQVRDLVKRYRSPAVPANDGLTFDCLPGEAFGLLGANGAGKTTLVRQLVGLLAPTSGEIHLFGEPVVPGRSVGRSVSFLPQGTAALAELKVAEAIRWTATLRGCGTRTARSETEELIDALRLGGLEERPLRKLSGGQRRLVQIGMALAGRLPVVILDEPTADVDPVLRHAVWALIAARKHAGSTIVLVTHDVAEAEHVLDRVTILDRGRAVIAGTPAQLKANMAHRTRLEIVVAEHGSATAADVEGLIGVEAKVDGRRVSGWVPADEAVRTLEKVTTSFPPAALEDVRLVTPSLEDVYLETSGHRLGEDVDG